MRIKKKNNTGTPKLPEQTGNDPFLRRIKVQRTILKKMLDEIDLPSKPEDDQKPETLSEL